MVLQGRYFSKIEKNKKPKWEIILKLPAQLVYDILTLKQPRS